MTNTDDPVRHERLATIGWMGGESYSKAMTFYVFSAGKEVLFAHRFVC